MIRFPPTAAAAVLLLQGCCLPVPWEAWSYLPTSLESQISDPDFRSEYVLGVGTHPTVYLGDIGIELKTKSVVVNGYKSDSPYVIHITMELPSDEPRKLVVHSIKVTDSDKNTYPYVPAFVNGDAAEGDAAEFPITMTPYRIGHYQKDCCYGTLSNSKTLALALKPRQGANVKVTIDLEVETRLRGAAEDENRLVKESQNDLQNIRKTLTFEFMPYAKSGLLRCLAA